MRFQTLNEWLSWQEQLHPKEIDLGLERVAAVWRRMHPEGINCPVISVAGTNGKGSSVALLDAILRAAGYRVGSYTSPHFLRYNERICIDNKEVADQALCESFERIDRMRDNLRLTYFEFSTLAALDLFIKSELDVVILEVGLGGRLDAVNIVDADAVLITTIAMDHMDWLGDDLQQIGREKAGIMRTGRPAVVADNDPPQSVIDFTDEIGARLYLSGRDFQHRDENTSWYWQSAAQNYDSLPQSALTGQFQQQNAAAVVMILTTLQERLPVSEEAIRNGLRQVELVGRFQRIQNRVPLLLDVAHNPQAARALRQNLEAETCRGPTYAVFSMLADKEIELVVETMLPVVDRWFLAPLNTSRSIPVDQVAEIIEHSVPSEKISSFNTIATALDAAQSQLLPGGRVVIFGSFFTVAEALSHLREPLNKL